MRDIAAVPGHNAIAPLGGHYRDGLLHTNGTDGPRELNKCSDTEMRRFYLDNAVRGGHASRVVHRWIEDWKHNKVEQQAVAAAQPTLLPPEPAEPEKFCCALCGGYRDPWNFTNVTLHKFEWEQIQRSLREAANVESQT